MTTMTADRLTLIAALLRTDTYSSDMLLDAQQVRGAWGEAGEQLNYWTGYDYATQTWLEATRDGVTGRVVVVVA